MSIFSGLFGKKSEVVAVFDINSSSVGGAYVGIEEGQPPTVIYTKRVPVELRNASSETAAVSVPDLERALKSLCEALISEGAPELARVKGSGRIHRIIASVSSPWQQVAIRTEVVEQDRPFTVSRALFATVLKKTGDVPEGHEAWEESVVAALLNGYETRAPFGKKAKRVDLVILSSSIEATVAARITDVLRSVYHTHAVRLVAFSPVAYAALRELYPHEKDFLAIIVSGETTDITLIKRGLLTSTISVSSGTNDLLRATRNVGIPGDAPKVTHLDSLIDPSKNEGFRTRAAGAEAAFLDEIGKGLRSFSERYALPRTIFLLAESESREFLRRTLDAAPLRSLWLSDEPLSIVPVLPKHALSRMKAAGAVKEDTTLFLLAFSADTPLRRLA